MEGHPCALLRATRLPQTYRCRWFAHAHVLRLHTPLPTTYRLRDSINYLRETFRRTPVRAFPCLRGGHTGRTPRVRSCVNGALGRPTLTYLHLGILLPIVHLPAQDIVLGLCGPARCLSSCGRGVCRAGGLYLLSGETVDTFPFVAASG